MTGTILQVHGERQEVYEPRIRIVPFDQIQLGTEPRCAVQGLIPQEGLVVIWGPPKCGKSFYTFDLAMHVALGWVYRGRKVQQGPVVYCAFEGQWGFEARVEAFRQRHLAEHHEPVPFYLEPVRLTLVKDCKALITTIRVTLGDAPPRLVVLDTLNRSFLGSENSDIDMTAYIEAADAVREAFHCAVIIVHHCGYDTKHPRGHTSLAGAVDAQLRVTKNAAKEVVVTVVEAKDGPEGATLVSRLETLVVGMDDDRHPIQSCVIAPVEASGATSQPSKPRLPSSAHIVLGALVSAIPEHGEVPTPAPQIPPGIKTVRLDVWRERAYASGISSSPETRARQQAFKRAHDKLLATGYVGTWEGLYWPII